MRAAYLAQDRPDLQVATRSLAQGLQRPTTSHMLMLKRVARYLRYRPRMAQFFPHQSKLSPFVMWSDADHAGCVKTRKSVSGGVLMAGGCCIKTYSKGQGVVSLSSGESEYYALVSGASNLLGEVSTAKDWGLQPESEVFMDASAGIAMGSRRGLGKAKHVDTQYHWVQDRVAKRYFRLKKVDTGDMLADVLTKPVVEEKMNKALRNKFSLSGRWASPDTESIDGLSVAMSSCTYQNSPSSKHLDSPCLRTGSGGVIRYVYSIDYVTCSIYVCICAAAILVLSATFELTEWKGADQCSGVFIRFKSPNSLFNTCLDRYYCMRV